MGTNIQKPTSQQTLQQRELAKQKPNSKIQQTSKPTSQQADQNIDKPPGQQPTSQRLPKGPAAEAKPEDNRIIHYVIDQ